jgi:hypothetical protein
LGVADAEDGLSVQMIGEVLVASGLITAGQLQRALNIQQVEPDRLLGEILVDMGCLTPEELVSAAIGQLADRIAGHQGRSTLVGQVLVDAKLINQAQLDSALAYQQLHGGKLGEILVRLRLASQPQIETILRHLPQ